MKLVPVGREGRPGRRYTPPAPRPLPRRAPAPRDLAPGAPHPLPPSELHPARARGGALVSGVGFIVQGVGSGI